MTTQRHPGADLSHEGAERVQGEGREGFVASMSLAGILAHEDAKRAALEQERDDLAARLAEAEARADEAEARFNRYREQFREITFDGMSVADWHTKHCAAQQVAVEAQAKVAHLVRLNERLPEVTEGPLRIATAKWAECDRDAYSLAIEEAQWVFRAALADEEGR